MAETVERRTVTTRTIRSANTQELKDNISGIASEIERVRDRAEQEARALQEIRGMLNVDTLNDLLRAIDALEARIEEIETEGMRAREESTGLQENLEQEQDRLRKLWDAYKTQEDELQRLKRDYPLMEEKLFERERTIDALRRDVDEMAGLKRVQADYDSLLTEHQALQTEAARMDEELDLATNALKEMEAEIAEHQAMGDVRLQNKELEATLDEERERLAKLYRVYEDQKQEMEDLSARLGDWEAWFQKLQPHFQGICEGKDAVPR